MNLEQIVKLRFKISDVKKPKKMADLEDACWEGYEPIGTKELDGRTVPNCVPIKEEQAKVKEGFPIPSPSGDEDEQKYIGRCISEIGAEYTEDGQAYAVCKSKWDEK